MGIFIKLAVLVFSIVIHETAHGYVASLRGDDTAKNLGRLSLNPIRHIDPVGSIILPILLSVSKLGIVFGWAKPVPINPYNFKNPKVDTVLVSAAGPASNLMLALIAGIFIRILPLFSFIGEELSETLVLFLFVVLVINIVLALFNLIPLPPLDGSKLIILFMPDNIARRYLSINPLFAMLILFLFVYSGIFFNILQVSLKFFVYLFSGLSV